MVAILSTWAPTNKYSLALDALENPVEVLVLHVLVETRVAPEGLGAVLALMHTTWGSDIISCNFCLNKIPFNVVRKI